MRDGNERADAPVINVDGHAIPFEVGDTIGACLMRRGVLALRRSKGGSKRGIFCGIGICNECLVTCDSRRNVRACVTRARPGLSVQTAANADWGEE